MINIAHFVVIETSSGRVNRFQNFFHSETGGAQMPDRSKIFASDPSGGEDASVYTFVPFAPQGSTAQINGDNDAMTLLFPFSTFGVRLVEEADGNRLSKLQLKTVWLETNDPTGGQYAVLSRYTEYFLGIGASFSDTVIELRFRSAMDSVGSRFPAATFTKENAGRLPVEAQIRTR